MLGGARAASLERLACVALAAVVGISGCGHEDASIEALKADPMATVSVPGFKPTTTDTRSSGSALGKPRHAQITRVFRGPNDVIRQGELVAVAELAREHGWEVHRLAGGLYEGTKLSQGIRMSIDVAVNTLQSPQTLVIGLLALD